MTGLLSLLLGAIMSGQVIVCPQRAPELCIYSDDSREVAKLLRGIRYSPVREYAGERFETATFVAYFIDHGRIVGKVLFDEKTSLDAVRLNLLPSLRDMLLRVGGWRSLVWSGSVRGAHDVFVRGNFAELEMEGLLGCDNGTSLMSWDFMSGNQESKERVDRMFGFMFSSDRLDLLTGIKSPFMYLEENRNSFCGDDSCGVRVGVVDGRTISVPGVLGSVPRKGRHFGGVISDDDDPCVSIAPFSFPRNDALLVDSSGISLSLRGNGGGGRLWNGRIPSFQHLNLLLSVHKWYYGVLYRVAGDEPTLVGVNCDGIYCSIGLDVLGSGNGKYCLRWSRIDTIVKPDLRIRRAK